MSDKWIDEWLGVPRFQRYVSLCDGHRDKAFELYAWNMELGLALLRDISALEVALRNAYDAAISARWNGSNHWLLDFDSPFLRTIIVVQKGQLQDQSYLVRRDILQAVQRAGGARVDPGKIVAELGFGFWTRLTETRFEKQFWVPYINHAYGSRVDRSRVHDDLRNIRLLRNRIAHHEPVFGFPNRNAALEVPAIHPAIMRTLHELSGTAAEYIQSTSRVLNIFAAKP